MDIKPLGQNILVKLPDYQKDRTRKTKAGIIIPHLKGNHQHEATHGTVMAVGADCTFVQVGDEVFFSQLCISQGKQNVGRDECADKEANPEVPVFYLEGDDADYLIMPWEKVTVKATDVSGTWELPVFWGVIALIRGNEVICCNNYYLMEDAYDKGQLVDGMRLQKKGGLFIAKLQEEEEKNKKFRILHAPAGSIIQAGDEIVTNPQCDIPLEGEFNYQHFPKGTCWIDGENILAVFETELAA